MVLFGLAPRESKFGDKEGDDGSEEFVDEEEVSDGDEEDGDDDDEEAPVNADVDELDVNEEDMDVLRVSLGFSSILVFDFDAKSPRCRL